MNKLNEGDNEPGEGDLGVLEEEELLVMLVVLVALSTTALGSSPSSEIVQALRRCIGSMIFSSMSPITWKLGSTMKSMKPATNRGSVRHSEVVGDNKGL